MKEKLKQKVKSYSFWTGLSASIVVLAKEAISFTIIPSTSLGIVTAPVIPLFAETV